MYIELLHPICNGQIWLPLNVAEKAKNEVKQIRNLEQSFKLTEKWSQFNSPEAIFCKNDWQKRKINNTKISY